MKKSEIIATIIFFLFVVIAELNVPFCGILLIFIHLAYLGIIGIDLIKSFGANSLLSFLYKMYFTMAILFLTNEYPGALHLWVVGLSFAIISIIVMIVQKIENKRLLEPILFAKIGSFIVFVLRWP